MCVGVLPMLTVVFWEHHPVSRARNHNPEEGQGSGIKDSPKFDCTDTVVPEDLKQKGSLAECRAALASRQRQVGLGRVGAMEWLVSHLLSPGSLSGPLALHLPFLP